MRVAALSLVFLAAGVAPAQIVLKPSSGEAAKLRPKTLDLDVTIRKGVAESKFDYTFANEGEWRGEADFLIEIPENGVVTGFAYWYEGEKVIARVTEKERARAIYKAITTRQRDPALIEMVGKRTFRVKVFPIQANADLRVELKMVQALPSTPNGAQLRVPLKRLGKLEKIDIDVQGAGPFATSVIGGSLPNFQYRSENVTTPDLRVTVLRPKRPYVADFRAARSGGTGGFFALTLTAANGVSRPRLSFAGVTVKDVMGLPARMVPGRAYTVVGRYENVRPGAKMFLAGASGARFSEVLDFSAAPEPNGPAAKLWAWAKIGRSTSRKEIIALSERHTVPSRYTSWIAIPTAERKRFAREIAMGDLRRTGQQMVRTVTRYGANSAAGQREIAAYRTRAKALGIDPNEVYDEKLASYASNLSQQWRRETKRHGERSARAQRMARELETLGTIGAPTYELVRYHQNEATALAKRVYEDRFAGRKDAAARRREAELRRHARLATSSGDGVQNYLEIAEGYSTDNRARRIAQAERAGERISETERDALERQERALGRNAGSTLKKERGELAYTAQSNIAREINNELSRDEPDLTRLRELAAKKERERKNVEQGGFTMTDETWALRQKVGIYLVGIREGRREPEGVPAFRQRLSELAIAAGLEPESAETAFRDQLDSDLNQAAFRLRSSELVARRDQTEVKTVQAEVDRLKVIGAKESTNWAPSRGEIEQDLRNEYVQARHDGRDADDLYSRLASSPETWKGKEYPRNRADLLKTLTELDRMDSRPLSTAETKRKAELERQAGELHARVGDPIVTFDAPADAIGLTVVMPDGTRLPMTWVTRRARWEARFDIPVGTPDGPFAVRIEGFSADGAILRGRAEFRVDSKAPSVQIERDGSRLVARTDVDVVRAVMIGADGSRREMVRHAPGRFALRDVPAGVVRVIATDRAHNRSDMAPDVPAPGSVPVVEPVDPALNVQALAQYGDRLWISTLDAGGRFEGEESVPEVGPWPRQAATFAHSLAVRTATGEVVVFDGRTWATVERDATTLATDGDTLLVGIVGGWIERSGRTRRSVRLPELAGRVVTCLLGDGDRLWIGTQGRGIYEWDRKAGKGRWHDERNGLADDWITVLGKDGQDRIVAGTFVGGALTLSGDAWVPIVGTEGMCVTAISGDLVATRHGLVRDGKLVSIGEAQALTSAHAGWRGKIVILP